MTSLQARALSRATMTAPDASRLELLEYYLVHNEDVAGCAQASLEWLGRYAGVKRSVCLAVDGDGGMLTGIAGYGVSSEDVDLFTWPLTDTRDPLVAALAGSSPVVFKPGKSNGHVGRVPPVTPLGGGPFTAIPLRGTEEGEALGLLLLRPWTGSTADISWLATVLGQKVEQIRGRGSLSEDVRKLRR